MLSDAEVNELDEYDFFVNIVFLLNFLCVKRVAICLISNDQTGYDNFDNFSFD